MPPTLFKTPPYVTARPVVTHRKLSFLSSLPSSQSTASSTSSSPNSSSSTLRFIVLATDGLWDQLSSEDVVSLVGGYLAGVKGTISKDDLATVAPTQSSSLAKTVEGKDSGLRRRAEGSWAFEDDNVSTHLIRNAFGGGDEARLRRMVSIPSPLARRYRDDVTVTVVWWEPGQEGQAKTEQVKIPAKL
jgi:pyruvate dehydrogenase phosphatase